MCVFSVVPGSCARRSGAAQRGGAARGPSLELSALLRLNLALAEAAPVAGLECRAVRRRMQEAPAGPAGGVRPTGREPHPGTGVGPWGFTPWRKLRKPEENTHLQARQRGEDAVLLTASSPSTLVGAVAVGCLSLGLALRPASWEALTSSEGSSRWLWGRVKVHGRGRAGDRGRSRALTVCGERRGIGPVSGSV